MNNSRAIIDFIQKRSLEDEEINNLLTEIDEMDRENTKLENQLEELESEHVRLKIERHNLETISSFNDVCAIENLDHTFQKIYKDYIELRSLIDKIDFTKILKCNHMEMEAKCRKEWQPLKDSLGKTLDWHQKMEQRHIVQRYRRTEIELGEVEIASKIQLKSIKASLKQSDELIDQAKAKRNNIIIALIKGRRDMDDLSKKMIKLNQYEVYIEDLRQEKLKIQNHIQQTQLKAFNPQLISSNTNNFSLIMKPNEEASNFIMPKFPSFSDILESFKQAENITTNIAVMQNTTSCRVKSILHTPNTSITTKQTKNVRFKLQLEEYQSELTEIKTETDVEEMSAKTAMEINEFQETGENVQVMKDVEKCCDIETIDLLTPADNIKDERKEVLKEINYFDQTTNTKQIANKSNIEVQDCVIFKTLFPLEELNCTKDNEQFKENIPTNTKLSSAEDMEEILNTTKSSFYEDFLKDTSTSSSEASPKKNMDFEIISNENEASVFFSKGSNDEKQITAATNNTNTSEIQDFLDFGSSRGFTFDSDDNISDSYKPGSMDFM